MAKSTNNEAKKEIPVSMAYFTEAVEGLYDTSRVETVYAEPVTVDGRTVINAAEVIVVSAFGGGGDSSPTTAGEDEELVETGGENVGMGAGVGGFAQARPVAVVIIDSDGVRVEPVVDATKLGLAALTALGGMFFLLARMLRQSARG